MVNGQSGIKVCWRRLLSWGWGALLMAGLAHGASPRLVVVLVVDGLSQNQLMQNTDLFGTGGFNLLLRQGAWFSQAQYDHIVTMTASGHATLLTGAHPSSHGIVGNDWLEPETGRRVYCVEDESSTYLEGPSEQGAVSPRNLLVPTLGDELRLSTGGQSKVVGISLKDRSAILTAGKSGQAYFYRNGRFITTSYYASSYPQWWHSYYETQPQESWLGARWEPLLSADSYWKSQPETHTSQEHPLGRWAARLPFSLPVEAGTAYYSALRATPFGDRYLFDFARAVTEGERLGKNPKGLPDLLVISLSTHDYVNHDYGPESLQSQDHLLHLDRELERFLDFLQGWIGLDQILLALSADHGFPRIPEHCQEAGLGGGRIDPSDMLEKLNEHLGRSFGASQYVLGWETPSLYLNRQALAEKNLPPEEVQEEARRFLLSYPGVAAAFSRSQLKGRTPSSRLGRKVLNSWNESRSGDLVVVALPCWYLLGNPRQLATTHGSPYQYDTNVPLILMGAALRPGKYAQADLVDLAPTLAHLLQIQPPAASEGRVLVEILR